MPRLLKIEQPHHLRAFECYYAQGEKRSYPRLAAEIGVGVNTIKLWGRSLGWSERIAERDRQAARLVAAESQTAQLAHTGERRRFYKAAFAKYLADLKDGRIKFQADDLAWLLEELYGPEGQSAGGPPATTAPPERVVAYVRSLLTTDLIDAYRIIRTGLERDFPEYTVRRLPPPETVRTDDDRCTTTALLDAALAERGADPKQCG